MRDVIQYIDLPGIDPAEPTFLGVNNKIILNKHRDVVIQINLLPTMAYKVDASHSPIYNARDKKIVPCGKTVEFKDGERLHLWVGKSFKGRLRVTSSNDKVIGSYAVADCDPQQCGSGLLDKPAPFIVMIGKPKEKIMGSAASAQPGNLFMDAGARKLDFLRSPIYVSNVPGPGAPPIKEEIEVMHIVEIKSLPQAGEAEINRLLEFFGKGGDETAIDSKGILTRNWLWAQIGGVAAYGADNAKWIEELWGKSFTLQKVRHKSGVKYYVVFKGWPGLRTYMSAAKYGAANAKVLSITSGAGNGRALRHAAWDATKGSLKKAGAVAVVFTITLGVAEWHNDYAQVDPKTGQRKKDLSDLFAKIGIDIVKALGSAAVASLVTGMLLIPLMMMAIGAAPIVLVIAVAVGTAIGVGYLMDLVDKKWEVTDKISSQLRTISKPLEDKNPTDYKGYTYLMEEFYGLTP